MAKEYHAMPLVLGGVASPALHAVGIENLVFRPLPTAPVGVGYYFNSVCSWIF